MGSSDRRSYQMNISIPRDLKARMDAVSEPVNWSQTAAQAFEAKLLELESRKREVGKMADVIARLKAAAELEANEEYQAGHEAGQRWAKEDATPKQLHRLTDHIESSRGSVSWWEIDYPGWNAPWGATGYFALTVMGLDARNASRGDDEEFWERALGDEAERILDADFFHGFGDGAAEVWAQVKDKL